MNPVNILERLETALLKRNSLLVEKYLLPGLPEKKRSKRFGRLLGNLKPLHQLYAWHDGTKFVHLGPDETYAAGIAKVSFVPLDTFLFTDSEQAIGMMQTWETVARRRSALKKGVWRYFPLFCGTSAKFMLDLEPSKNTRIIFYDNTPTVEDEPTDSFEVAYPTFDAFLADLLRANETGERLGFLSKK